MNPKKIRVSVSQGNRKKRSQKSDKVATPPPSAERIVSTSKDSKDKLLLFQVQKELEKIPKSSGGTVTVSRKLSPQSPRVQESSSVPLRAKKQSVDSKSQLNSSSSSLSREEEVSSVKKELKKKKANFRQNNNKKRSSCGEGEVEKTAESGGSTTAIEEESSYEKSIRRPSAMMTAKTPSKKLDPKIRFGQIMKTFAAHCNKLNIQELYRQFNSLPDPTKEQCKAYLEPKNSNKNRYNNIYCLDKTRVDLSFLAEIHGYSRYIHANRVIHDSLGQPFIITQGPKKSTTVDFWRMIWQENCTFVIMLCNYVENNRPKCHEYFVDSEIGGCIGQGPMQVTTETKMDTEGIRSTQLRIQYQGEERLVTHLMFPHWPDHEAPSPEDFNHLFHLLQRVRNAPSPVVVHCSAGVGRSGTLVALEMCVMDASSMLRDLNVLQTVRKLRSSRCYAVQTFPQYMCLFLAMLHYGKMRGVLHDSDTAHFTELVDEFYRQQS